MPQSLTISLPVEDRRRAHDFYRAAFGYETVGAPEADGMPEPLQFALNAHTRLMLVPTVGLGWVIGADRIAPAGSSECLFTFTEPNADAVRERVTKCVEAGGTVVHEPAKKDWGFQGIVADPDGHLWMIMAEG